MDDDDYASRKTKNKSTKTGKNFNQDNEEEEEEAEESEAEEQLTDKELDGENQKGDKKNNISKKNVCDKSSCIEGENEEKFDPNDPERLQKRIKVLETKLADCNNNINNLKKQITEKDNKIKLITKTNQKLVKSMNTFSKEVDNKLSNKQGILGNIKKVKKNYGNDSSDDVKQKELDNAINIIKILKNDNQRLQTKIDNYENDNKVKDLENMNKLKSDENSNLEEQIKNLKKELNDYKICQKKIKTYEKQIQLLTKENKLLKDNNRNLNEKLTKKFPQNKNNPTYSYNEDNDNKKIYKIKKDNYSSVFKLEKNTIEKNRRNDRVNFKDNSLKSGKRGGNSLNRSMGYLPQINSKSMLRNGSEKFSNIKLSNNYKKNYENTADDVLKTFFNSEDIIIIQKIFQNNASGFEEFKIKLCIINKSKESLINKYNIEIKKYNERITSAQEQIEYLNGKNRETEVNYKKLQTQMNEFNIQKKLLKKKIKMLEQNLADRENYISENFGDIIGNNKKEGNNIINLKVEDNEIDKTASENEEAHENNSDIITNENKNNISNNDND